MTKRDFVDRMARATNIAVAKGAIINTHAVIAQAALESGWGLSLLARKYNNLFGIKKATDWTGPTVRLWTLEYWGNRYHRVLAEWAVWPSWNECVVSYSQLIRSRWWFADALPHADPPHGDGDAYGWIYRLVDADRAGELRWATSPDYVVKVIERVGREVAAIREGVVGRVMSATKRALGGWGFPA